MKQYLILMSSHTQKGQDPETINIHASVIPGLDQAEMTFTYRKKYNINGGGAEYGSVSFYELEEYNRETGAMKLGPLIDHYVKPLISVTKYNTEKIAVEGAAKKLVKFSYKPLV